MRPAAVLALALLAPTPLARAQEPASPRSGTLRLFVDNDIFAGTDRRYTNGERLAWTWAELGRPGAAVRVPRWLDAASRALSFGRTDGRFVSVFLDLRMFTPEDITKAETPAGEHPYAGYTGAGLSFQSRDAATLDVFEFTVGLVGPDSLAGAAQRRWHKTFGFERPRGWAGELKDEPVLGASYERRRKVLTPSDGPGPKADAAVRAGGSLSNALTAGWAGAGIRAGWRLPDDFAAASISPDLAGEARRGAAVGTTVFAYLAVEGQAVLRDIFLDGNLGREGPSVDKYPFRGRAAAGLAVGAGRWTLNAGYVAQTRWYVTERRGHVYGTISLSCSL